MSAHHDRVRALLLVHGLEADCRVGSCGPFTVAELTERVIRIQARLDGVRGASTVRPIEPRQLVDTGADATAWMLAVYDAALVGLCRALGLHQALLDDGVGPEGERQRVELALLSSVLPIG